MPTIIGYRMFYFLCWSILTNSVRIFFPPTEAEQHHESEGDWEEVEAGESAENGPPVVESQEDKAMTEDTLAEAVKVNQEKTFEGNSDEPVMVVQTEEANADKAKTVEENAEENEDGVKIDLPDVPASEPVADGPVSKKQKTDEE